MIVEFTPHSIDACRDLYDHIKARYNSERKGLSKDNGRYFTGISISELSAKEVYYLLLSGANIHGYSCFLYSPVNILSNEIPDYFPNYEEGKTFGQWSRNVVEHNNSNQVLMELVSGTSQVDLLVLEWALSQDSMAIYDVRMFHSCVKFWDNEEPFTLPEIAKDPLSIFLDWKQAREYMQHYVERIGWGNMSIDEREVAAYYRATNISNITGILGTGAKFEASDAYVKNMSMGARGQRFGLLIAWLEKSIGGSIGVDKAYTVAITAILNNFRESFVRYGFEGTIEQTVYAAPDTEGLYDYLNATEGTSFETTGIRAQASEWNVNQSTLNFICDISLNILRYGQKVKPFYITE